MMGILILIEIWQQENTGINFQVSKSTAQKESKRQKWLLHIAGENFRLALSEIIRVKITGLVKNCAMQFPCCCAV